MKWMLLLLILLGGLAPARAQMRHETSSKSGRINLAYTQPGQPGQPRPKRRLPAVWFEPGDAAGDARLEIDRSRQLATFYIGDRKVGQSPVATGRPGFETPAGTFNIKEKKRSHYSNLYGSFVCPQGKFLGEADNGDTPPRGARYEAAPMPYFMRLTDGGVGLHQGFVPGYAASHGCIRLPKEAASQFYAHLAVGDEVVIR